MTVPTNFASVLTSSLCFEIFTRINWCMKNSEWTDKQNYISEVHWHGSKSLPYIRHFLSAKFAWKNPNPKYSQFNLINKPVLSASLNKIALECANNNMRTISAIDLISLYLNSTFCAWCSLASSKKKRRRQEVRLSRHHNGFNLNKLCWMSIESTLRIFANSVGCQTKYDEQMHQVYIAVCSILVRQQKRIRHWTDWCTVVVSQVVGSHFVSSGCGRRMAGTHKKWMN